MYSGQKTLDPLRQQCSALKERLDRCVGHGRTVVRPKGDNIQVMIDHADILKLRGRIPDSMGMHVVEIELKGPLRVKKAVGQKRKVEMLSVPRGRH